MATTTTNRTDIYSKVTNQIVEQLERGVRPWLRPGMLSMRPAE